MVSASRNPRNLHRGHKAFLLCFPDAFTLRSVTVSSSFVYMAEDQGSLLFPGGCLAVPSSVLKIKPLPQ